MEVPRESALSSAPGLCCQRLTTGYTPGRPVVRSFSATLRPGQLTALIGPNASGKSTLLHAMLGRLTPWEGSVTLDGQPVSSLMGPNLARRLSYIPQRGEAGFAFSVRQMVAMGRLAFRDQLGIDEALHRCGLEDLADTSFHQLSGGQQQRVLVARAWAQAQPAAPVRRGNRVGAATQDSFRGGLRDFRGVLADEPVSSLDLQQVQRVMGLLRSMADEGLAVLVVLHSLDLVEPWADEVWLMDNGQLIAQGSPMEVLQPAVLEPVYRVRLRRTQVEDGRWVLHVPRQAAASAGAGATLEPEVSP